MLTRLDHRFKALIILIDGSYYFGSSHYSVTNIILKERGFVVEDKHIAGYYEITELRKVVGVLTLNAEVEMQVLESDEFKEYLCKL